MRDRANLTFWIYIRGVCEKIVENLSQEESKRVKKKNKKSVPSVLGYSMGSQTLGQLSRYADDKEKREKQPKECVWNPLAIIEQ